jgi:hypothetical protein
MFGYHLSVFCMVVMSFVLQQFLPVWDGLYEARVLLVPLVFLCSSVTVNVAPMLLLAFLCGALWDAQHLLGSHGGDESIYQNKVDTMPFGYSIILYAGMGFIMQGIQPLFRAGKWRVSVVLSSIAIFFYLSAEYLFITFVRGDFIVTRGVFLKIAFSSLMTTLFSPLVFWVLFRFAALFRYTVRYEGLKTGRRAPAH